jgi:hypothetical protein
MQGLTAELARHKAEAERLYARWSGLEEKKRAAE